MQLKMYALCGSAVALWLAPLVVLNDKVSWHKAVQGLSLGTAIACAVGAGNLAKKLADEAEIEAMKVRAIKADVEDEISTEVYVSQQQRQQEAEAILNPVERTDEQEAELNSIRESLELLLNNKSSDSGELAVVNLSARQREQIELILRCHIKGIYGKNKILKEVWGVSAGSSQAYRDAKAEYEFLMPFVKGEGDEQ